MIKYNEFMYIRIHKQVNEVLSNKNMPFVKAFEHQKIKYVLESWCKLLNISKMFIWIFRVAVDTKKKSLALL